MTFADYITQNLNKPFVWGQQDCVLFAARWVEIATGRNVLYDVEPWFSEAGAIRVLRSFSGFQSIMDRKFPRINQHLAVDGDMALHKNCLRLYSGRHICSPGEAGLVFFSRMEAECAWRCS